jgi:hypothetical protein
MTSTAARINAIPGLKKAVSTPSDALCRMGIKTMSNHVSSHTATFIYQTKLSFSNSKGGQIKRTKKVTTRLNEMVKPPKVADKVPNRPPLNAIRKQAMVPKQQIFKTMRVRRSGDRAPKKMGFADAMRMSMKVPIKRF